MSSQRLSWLSFQCFGSHNSYNLSPFIKSPSSHNARPPPFLSLSPPLSPRILDRDLIPRCELPTPPPAAAADDDKARPLNETGNASDSEEDSAAANDPSGRPRTKEEKQRAKKARRRARKLQLQLAQGTAPQPVQQTKQKGPKVTAAQRLKQLAQGDEFSLPSRRELRCTFHADDDGRGVVLFRRVRKGEEILLEGKELYGERSRDVLIFFPRRRTFSTLHFSPVALDLWLPTRAKTKRHLLSS